MRNEYMIAVRINSPSGPRTHRAWNNRAAEADAFGKALANLGRIIPAVMGVVVTDLNTGRDRFQFGEEIE